MPIAKKAAGNPAEPTASQTAAMSHPIARMPCQRPAFRKDKAIAGLRAGHAARKVFPPHFNVEARGCGRLRARVLSVSCRGMMHGTRERV